MLTVYQLGREGILSWVSQGPEHMSVVGPTALGRRGGTLHHLQLQVISVGPLPLTPHWCGWLGVPLWKLTQSGQGGQQSGSKKWSWSKHWGPLVSSSPSTVVQIHILGSTTEMLTLNFVVICLLTFENETWWLDGNPGCSPDCQGWGCRALSSSPDQTSRQHRSALLSGDWVRKALNDFCPGTLLTSLGAGTFTGCLRTWSLCCCSSRRPGQGRVGTCQEQEEPEMDWAKWGNWWNWVLQRFLERSLHCPSRTLIMVTLTWTPVNSSNLWSRMKPPSTSPPMQTRRTTSCLGEWH